MAVERSLTIETPGLYTTIQDLGRSGMARFGVTPGGAMDRGALILGNRLLGNPIDAAGIESTLSGPAIRFNADAVIAVTGADFGATLDGAAIPRWRPVLAKAGSLLRLDSPVRGPGARAYLCVAGGFDLPVVLGSRSTDVVGKFGGFEGRQLQTGDQLPIGEPELGIEAILQRRLGIEPPHYEQIVSARVVLGPQLDRFTEAGIATFLAEPYRVTSKADRTGIRLEGGRIKHVTDADLVSEGIAHGAIQIPGDGQPIVLMASRGTVGGYTKIATVIGADLDALGQVRPGQSVTFSAVSVEDARELTRAYFDRIGPNAITEQSSDEGVQTMGSGWDPDGVIRIIAEAERTGVSYLRLEVASAGLTLEISRNGGGPLSPAGQATAPPIPDGDVDVVAPVLGTFYRRRTPDEPALVEVGDQVEAGALLGLIEVMKTYHEVSAPVAGTITSILAEDGHYVEYGQSLLRLSPAG
ncbi:MAG: 5-oxoprolinase/urea amidolyase family protein [Thermomicrobiales bacterium]